MRVDQPGTIESEYSGGVALDHSDPSIVYVSREVRGGWKRGGRAVAPRALGRTVQLDAWRVKSINSIKLMQISFVLQVPTLEPSPSTAAGIDRSRAATTRCSQG